MSRPSSERPRATTVISSLGVLAVVSAVLGVVVAGLALPFVGVAGLAARGSATTMTELPQDLDTKPLAQTSTVLDANGDVIANFYTQNRTDVPLSDVSRMMVKAIIAIEDYRYYQHGALDVRGTFRALVTNVGSGGVVQGGSSITQQLVKQTLINQARTKKERLAATDETIARKLRELRYAVALENKHTKDWILERYLNTVYFGDGAYGVQAAAQQYFGVDAADLDLNQSAILAGLVQNPSAFDPTNHPDRTKQRRNVVLDRMAELNVVTIKRARATRQAGLKLDANPTPNGCLNSPVPLFCQYVLEYLLKDPSLGNNRAERETMLRTGGLVVRTTVDQRYQRIAATAVRNHVNPLDQAIGALAMVQPGTGRVYAIAQSRPTGDDRSKGETFLNYVVPSAYGDSNGFQAGSTFKAFVLAAALEQGISLSTTLPASSAQTFDTAEFANCPGAPPFGGPYPVTGSGASGGVANLYTGTRGSINTFFINLEKLTGVCEPYNLAKAMGVRLNNPTGDEQGNGAERVVSFPLGIADVSPVEMAEAYATFANRGVHCDSRPVDAIEDRFGNVLKSYDPQCQRVMSQYTADAVNDVLRGVIEPGGFASAQALDQPAAGKTGTTQTGKAVWFVGYTPQVATAAMVAGANQLGAPQSLVGVTVGGTTQYDVQGATVAAPIWGEAMREIDGDFEYEDFVYPEQVDGVGDTSVYVPPPPAPPRRGRR